MLKLFLILSTIVLATQALQRKEGVSPGGLLGGMLGSVISTELNSRSTQTAAQSQEALKEQQGYSAIKAQQDVSSDTRLLEDELVKLQDEVRNIDKATYAERQELNMKLESKKLELLAAISRTAKILRAAYTTAYPQKKSLPIVIVPKDSSDEETIRASRLENEGLEESAKGLFTPCAAIAEELQQLYEGQKKTSNDFQKQAEALLSLPLTERLAFDKEKVFYWKQKAEAAQHAIEADKEALGITTTTTTTTTTPSQLSKIGGALLGGLKMEMQQQQPQYGASPY